MGVLQVFNIWYRNLFQNFQLWILLDWILVSRDARELVITSVKISICNIFSKAATMVHVCVNVVVWIPCLLVIHMPLGWYSKIIILTSCSRHVENDIFLQ
uniref:Uncharacterized protein n=1 Tax=Cacopsylla melanoneura TaxID=428564 RepID=A0A8D8X6S3_9HEMI